MSKRMIAVMLFSLGFIGCASRGGIFGVDYGADIPEGAIPEPAGTKIHEIQKTQVLQARKDLNVFYQADFVGKTAKLSPLASTRVAQREKSAPENSAPFIIEPSGDSNLDQERVSSVKKQLAEAGIDYGAVEVALPSAMGLRGPFAEASLPGSQLQGGRSGMGNRGFGGNNSLGRGF